jgi:hypothetical protein
VEWAEALRLLQQQAPGRRLLLKAPDHLGALADLLAMVPDATIAVCLRDPASTVPSLDSLLMTVYAVTARNLDPRRVSEVNIKALVADARRYMAFRDTLSPRIIEIPYAEIRADAPRAAASLYERAGLAFDDATERRLGDFAAAHRQHSHGVHRYRPEDYGTTAAGIRASFGDFAELSAASAVA